MTRRQILDEAIQCVCFTREDEYSAPENNFALIAEYWNLYLGGDCIKAHDVGVLMSLLKIARIQTGRYKADSYIDACGYLALAGEIGRGDTD